MIKLKPIDESNYRECVKLNVKQHQREYVENGNSVALTKAYVYRECTFPFAVYNDDVIVGFVQYREINKLGNYLIDKIMIKDEFQKRGYGTKVLNIIVDRMKTENKYKKLCLCVDIRNKEAIQLYKKYGFIQDEPEDAGELVLAITW